MDTKASRSGYIYVVAWDPKNPNTDHKIGGTENSAKALRSRYITPHPHHVLRVFVPSDDWRRDEREIKGRLTRFRLKTDKGHLSEVVRGISCESIIKEIAGVMGPVAYLNYVFSVTGDDDDAVYEEDVSKIHVKNLPSKNLMTYWRGSFLRSVRLITGMRYKDAREIDAVRLSQGSFGVNVEVMMRWICDNFLRCREKSSSRMDLVELSELSKMPVELVTYVLNGMQLAPEELVCRSSTIKNAYA